MVQTADKSHTLAKLNCPTSFMYPWKWVSAMLAEGSFLLHDKSRRLCLLLSCSYLWMAVRSLQTGQSSSSFLLGSAHLVNLTSFHLILPLCQAFKIYHKKQNLKLEPLCTDEDLQKTSSELHCSQGFVSLLSHRLQLFNILRGFFFNWVLLQYLIWMFTKRCWESREFSHTQLCDLLEACFFE